MEPLTVPGTLDSLSSIGTFVKEAAVSAGLDKKAMYRLRLAIDEIATNIILHRYEEAGRQGQIRLEARLDDKNLTIALEDTAVPFDPRSIPAPPDLHNLAEERNIGGLGVYLALKEVDGFSYESTANGNRNISVMKRPSA